MKTSLMLNFSIDRENKKINVEREFAAPINKVWAAWTKSELLDQWWAPKPWQARTKKMDFREGGHWMYAMVGPDGDAQWCRADFKSITPLKEFTGDDAFCDENGKINTDFPVAHWKCNFEESGNSTIANIEIRFNSIADLDKYIETGFKEGFTAGMENLDELLQTM